MSPIIDLLLGPVLQLVEKYIPSAEDRAKLQVELLQLQQNQQLKELVAQLQIATAQSQVNLAEAQSTEKFKSYWRPFVGWICASGLFFQFVFAPTATWVSALFGKTIVFPTLDGNTLMTLLFGMLGLGAYRTVEKVRGVA